MRGNIENREDEGGDSACPPSPPLLLERDDDVGPVQVL